MPLYFFYTMVQRVKNDQKLKSRGSCGMNKTGIRIYFYCKKKKKKKTADNAENRKVPRFDFLSGVGSSQNSKFPFFEIQ